MTFPSRKRNMRPRPFGYVTDAPNRRANPDAPGQQIGAVAGQGEHAGNATDDRAAEDHGHTHAFEEFAHRGVFRYAAAVLKCPL